MSGLAYRLFFGTNPATQEALDRVEEIVVEQEMDMAWEARIRLSLCMDEGGHWHHHPREFAAPFTRVRVELRAGGATWTPLIDGPVASYDSALDSQPGRSAVTVVVRDDSVLMNRKEAEEVFENRADHEIARVVFGRFPSLGGPPRIQPTTRAASAAVGRRGTEIQFLRQLAQRNGFRAYVLPGPTPGKSSGCFKPDAAGPGTLPALTLLGAGRHLADVTITENSTDPQRTTASTLRTTDQQVVSVETHLQDADLMRELPPVAEGDAAVRLLAPAENDAEDPEPRARAATASSAYAYRASARVLPGCYGAVLVPYEKVTVQAGPLPYSGAWLIRKVTHRITPNVYTQEFEALCNSQTPAGADAAAGGGGGGLSVSFSASLSIF